MNNDVIERIDWHSRLKFEKARLSLLKHSFDSLLTRYSVKIGKKLQFSILYQSEVGGEAKRMKLYPCDCLSGVSTKEQKSKFVPRLMPIIVDLEKRV